MTKHSKSDKFVYLCLEIRNLVDGVRKDVSNFGDTSGILKAQTNLLKAQSAVAKAIAEAYHPSKNCN